MENLSQDSLSFDALPQTSSLEGHVERARTPSSEVILKGLVQWNRTRRRGWEEPNERGREQEQALGSGEGAPGALS